MNSDGLGLDPIFKELFYSFYRVIREDDRVQINPVNQPGTRMMPRVVPDRCKSLVFGSSGEATDVSFSYGIWLVLSLNPPLRRSEACSSPVHLFA
jgi:hypothetical protein